jgi:hypothetical protein
VRSLYLAEEAVRSLYLAEEAVRSLYLAEEAVRSLYLAEEAAHSTGSAAGRAALLIQGGRVALQTGCPHIFYSAN